MKGRPAPASQGFLLLAMLCLCAAAAQARQANAQEGAAADSLNPQAGTTRKIDEYGKVGHCDETARLDNFAIELQNEPGSNGYLVIYIGKNDLPSWWPGVLGRAGSYLVNARGLDPARFKVINGGFREERTTELWVVPEHDPAPQPSNAVEFKLDRTKAYQWDEDRFEIAFTPDETEVAEAEGAEDEADASAEAEAETDAAEQEAVSAEMLEWEKEREKYSIEVSARGVYEEEPRPEEPRAAESKAVEGAAEEATADAEPDGPPPVGEIQVSLWWNVEKLADELKAVPDARVCLVYYWGDKSATQERVKEIIERAVVKTEEQLGLKRDRIILIDGGRSYEPGVELWVVPPGAQPPRPSPGQERKFGFYTMSAED